LNSLISLTSEAKAGNINRLSIKAEKSRMVFPDKVKFKIENCFVIALYPFGLTALIRISSRVQKWQIDQVVTNYKNWAVNEMLTTMLMKRFVTNIY
jgi:hypothetical protein